MRGARGTLRLLSARRRAGGRDREASRLAVLPAVFLAALVAVGLTEPAAAEPAGPETAPKSEAAEKACRPDRFGGQVCGAGETAVRVIAETVSPSGRHAFAWGAPDGIEREPDVENVRIVLVRLADGAVLAKLGGHYWSTGEMRANRQAESAVWAPDERAVVEIADSRWSTYSLRYVALAKDGAARTLDLLPLVETAARARLRQAMPRETKGREFMVSGDAPARLDARGRLSLGATLFVPKADASFDLAMRVAITRGKAGTPTAGIVSMRQVPSR
ncbi:MAG: hypothetical protein HXX10_17630 [Rhodoplanes sp.]|uniref:hypothetical protein n=1 Tax=Rhodoplanes sp. TaxID=1968906 RepID=UPI0017AE0F92|nr:hypothetical protein [Rhodoplanes sp.]NVO15858.1 hypothetical protein [Rhodoplanes sp.]